jgi:hypothetical protein
MKLGQVDIESYLPVEAGRGWCGSWHSSDLHASGGRVAFCIKQVSPKLLPPVAQCLASSTKAVEMSNNLISRFSDSLEPCIFVLHHVTSSPETSWVPTDAPAVTLLQDLN